MTAQEPARILIAAGGTGGHLFPAQALAEALKLRGYAIHLVTDARGGRYDSGFPAEQIHVVPSDTLRGGGVAGYARTAMTLAAGTARAFSLIGRVKPRAVVGFGGYPTVPPLLAASLRRVPTAIHEQNAVMGRANRLLAGRVDAVATSFPEVRGLAPRNVAKVTQTGAPVRAAVASAASPYPAPAEGDKFGLLVFGGSQGAKVLSDVVPAAIARLDETLRRRLSVVQQCREEDLAAARAAYHEAGVEAELAPFFEDLPRRIAEAHLVISRSGASTIAELAVIGRPAILVPLPHAIDNDQLLNARALAAAGGGWVMQQTAFTPTALSEALVQRAHDRDGLQEAAAAVRQVGNARVAEALADLVSRLAEGRAEDNINEKDAG